MDIPCAQTNVYKLCALSSSDSECGTIPDNLNITKVFCDQIQDRFQVSCDQFQNFEPGVSLPPDVTYPDVFYSTPPPLPEWPKSFKLVEETHDYMITYSVLSLAWAGSAVILLGEYSKPDFLRLKSLIIITS